MNKFKAEMGIIDRVFMAKISHKSKVDKKYLL